MEAQEFRATIVVPALQAIFLGGASAEAILMGTAAQETGFRNINQLEGGPGRGYFSMEIATHDDIWENFLAYRAELAARVLALAPADWRSLEAFPLYAAAMCRVDYLRAPEPLPAPDDIPGLARYWKRWYNTGKGKGTALEFVANFERSVLA